MSEQELDSMLGEIGGPCNYENMVKCFETKMSGFVNDPDDLVVGAFKSYNEECKFAFVFRNNVIRGYPLKGSLLFEGKLDTMQGRPTLLRETWKISYLAGSVVYALNGNVKKLSHS